MEAEKQAGNVISETFDSPESNFLGAFNIGVQTPKQQAAIQEPITKSAPTEKPVNTTVPAERRSRSFVPIGGAQIIDAPPEQKPIGEKRPAGTPAPAHNPLNQSQLPDDLFS